MQMHISKQSNPQRNKRNDYEKNCGGKVVARLGVQCSIEININPSQVQILLHSVEKFGSTFTENTCTLQRL